MSQEINGNDNQQAGRDIINIQNDRTPCLSADNPNAVKCPQCYQIVGRFSEMCSTRNCGLAVRKYFDDMEREKIHTKRKNNEAKVRSFFTKVLICSAVLTIIGLWFSIPSLALGGIITSIFAIKAMES